MNGLLALLMWALAASALHLRGRRQLVRAARVGHEVRGPLCTAQLALAGLERSARVEAIGLELRRAALALEDLSGSGRRRRPIEPVDVAALLSGAAHAWRALAEAHGATLAVEPGAARVVGDELRLAQACGNLVANAIEHGAANRVAGAIKPGAANVLAGAIDRGDAGLVGDAIEPGGLAGHTSAADGRVVLVRSSTVGGRVRVEVRDCGPGLPAPVGALVAAARGRRSPRGHGLAIAAAVAERHGGHLASVPAARGAHLVLELPGAPP
jgi:signal transduction histidine kinase